MKKYSILLVLVPVLLAGSFFYYLYRHDVKSLDDFAASYEKFDEAVANFSTGKTGDLESRARDALAELNAKATFRLSSLIKNDNVIPPVALEVADFSGKELDALVAYEKASQSKNGNVEALAQEYSDLTSKMEATYTRFQELAEVKD
jgi:hypothetical protein